MPENEIRLTSQMKWSVHPAKKQQTKTVLSSLFIGVFTIMVITFYGTFWGILGLVIFFFSLYPYYFPTHYEVDEETVRITNIFGTQSRATREFKKTYPGKKGILLSPFRHKTFLNHFRGVFLFLPDERDEIVDYLKNIIESPQGSLMGQDKEDAVG